MDIKDRMWNPLLTGWMATLALAAGLLALGAAGWLCVRRWPRLQAVWTTAILALAAYVGASWFGTLLNVHADLSEAGALVRHTAVVLLATVAAVLLVQSGARASRRQPPAG